MKINNTIVHYLLSFFQQFSMARLPFNESYNWLAITTASEVPISKLANLPLTIESEFSVVLASLPNYLLYDIYNHAYRHGGILNVTSLGQWNLATGLKNHLTQYKYTRRQDFHGIPLNFSYVVSVSKIVFTNYIFLLNNQ